LNEVKNIITKRGKDKASNNVFTFDSQNYYKFCNLISAVFNAKILTWIL
jgi:hypothetical protein